MSATMYGADPDALEAAAAELSSAAQELEQSGAELASTLGALAWFGRVAIRFTDAWNTRHASNLRATSGFLKSNADLLIEQARQQRTASSGTGGIAGASGLSGTVAAGASGASGADGGAQEGLEDLGTWLERIGIAGDGAEAILEWAKDADPEQLKRFVDAVDDEGVEKFITGLGKVVDVGTVVVNLAKDYTDPDNAGLPADERILHALTDATIRFALDEGTEKGIEYGTTVLLASLASAGGPLGTIAGGAAGKAIGKVAGIAVSYAVNKGVESVDGKYDVVDVAADQTVSGYRGVKDGAEWVSDHADDAADAAGAMVDGAQHAADSAAHAAGGAAHAVGDAAGSAAGHVSDAADAVADRVPDIPRPGWW